MLDAPRELLARALPPSKPPELLPKPPEPPELDPWPRWTVGVFEPPSRGMSRVPIRSLPAPGPAPPGPAPPPPAPPEARFDGPAPPPACPGPEARLLALAPRWPEPAVAPD